MKKLIRSLAVPTLLFLFLYPFDKKGKFGLKEFLTMPGIKFAALRVGRQKNSPQANSAAFTIATFISGDFLAHAERYRVTPEFLASSVLEKFTRDAPEAMVFISSEPLSDRGCAGCDLRARCDSANQPDRDSCYL